jgi:hypothetical protein
MTKKSKNTNLKANTIKTSGPKPANRSANDIEALLFHSSGKPGKVEMTPTKALNTQRDLALAYSPGVAIPCLEIAKDPGLAYDYTAKGNYVAVISNGTAVLGLGNLGALAGMPTRLPGGGVFSPSRNRPKTWNPVSWDVGRGVVCVYGINRVEFFIGKDHTARSKTRQELTSADPAIGD